MARKQQEKSQQTQQELMETAEVLFGQNGFLQTSITEITQQAGYAKGNFYRYWENKDELFLQIVEQKLATYRTNRSAGIDQAVTLKEVLRSIWDFLEVMVNDESWAKVFLEFTVQAARKPELRSELNQSRYRLSNRVFADLIRDFVETGYSPEKIGAMNTALFEGYMVHTALDTGVLDFVEVRETAIDLAVRKALK